jgi:hypothetical protein
MRLAAKLVPFWRPCSQKYHRLIATVMPENPLPGNAQLVAAMHPRARLWIIADSGKQARRWRVGRLGARCGDDDAVTVRAATVLSVVLSRRFLQ